MLNIINVFTVTFDQFKVSLLIKAFKQTKNYATHLTYCFLYMRQIGTFIITLHYLLGRFLHLECIYDALKSLGFETEFTVCVYLKHWFKLHSVKNLPFTVVSTSALQRCKQLLTKYSSSSVTLWGAGWSGISMGGLHWVKGLCMGVLCVAVCGQPEPSDEPASSGSVWLQQEMKHLDGDKHGRENKQ